MRLYFTSIIILYLTTSCGSVPHKEYSSQLIQPNSCYIYWHDTELKNQYYLQKNKVNYIENFRYDLYDGSIDIIVTKTKEKKQWYVKSLYSNKLKEYFYKKLKPVTGSKDISEMTSFFNSYLLISENDLINLVLVRKKVDCNDFGLGRI